MSQVVFCQAEDGIRDVAVTGVQTCALPICQKQSVSRANQEKRCHGSVVGKRKTHVPVGQRNHPMDITDRQRPVKLISGAQRRNSLRRDLRVQAHFIEITSRGKNCKREGKEGNAQEQESSVSGSAQQITHHDSANGGRDKSRRGTAAKSSRVILFSGCVRISSGAPCSTICPRLITAISSARCAAIAKSWEIKR